MQIFINATPDFTLSRCTGMTRFLGSTVHQQRLAGPDSARTHSSKASPNVVNTLTPLMSSSATNTSERLGDERNGLVGVPSLIRHDPEQFEVI